MAAYKDIQRLIKIHYGWTAKTCWIAHCQEIVGLPVRRAVNRRGDGRLVPCPPDKQEAIFEAFRQLEVVERRLDPH